MLVATFVTLETRPFRFESLSIQAHAEKSLLVWCLVLGPWSWPGFPLVFEGFLDAPRGPWPPKDAQGAQKAFRV